MSLVASEMTPADIAAVTGGGGNNGGGWGGNFGEWILIFLLAAMFGWGGMGMGGGMMGGMGMMWPWLMMNGFGGFGGRDGGCGCGCGCATQADLAAGFNNSAVLSSLNDLKLGQAGVQQTLCQGFNGINTTVLEGFHGVDNAVCTLGYQTQQGFNGIGQQLAKCCCDIERSIDGNTNAGLMNTMNIQRQISDCCCDLEKMNMQNRFDAQSYNCNTMQAIDKLGDRIIGWLSDDKLQSLRDENQALRFAASQANQNAFITANQEAQTATLLRRLGAECPQAAYIVNAPTPVTFPVNACGQVQFGGNGWNGGGCGCRSCA